MTEPCAVWVYAVPADAGEREWPAGVAGASVRLVAGAGLSAVVSDVPLAQFDAAALRRNMEDLDWLEAAARAHHEVIEAAARRGPVIPMRLATVYRDDGGVLAMLAGHEEEFRAGIGRIAGRLEWGVKAFAVPAERSAHAVTGPGAAPSGAAYLARRRSQLNDAEAVRRAAAAEADNVHAGLSRLAVLADLHPPQDPQLSGARTTMILNGTYLVDEADAGRFAAAVDQAARQHPAVRLELTGPWPPYSFAMVEARS